jgi:hypothetical protein
MSTYYITSLNNNLWEKTNAKTLIGAKRLATSEFGAGFNDDLLMVGEKSTDGQMIHVASKGNHPGAKWYNV